MKPLTTSICLLCVLSVSVGTRTSASISTRSAAFQISEIRSLSCHLFLYNGPVSSIRNNRGYCSLDEAYSICHSSFALSRWILTTTTTSRSLSRLSPRRSLSLLFPRFSLFSLSPRTPSLRTRSPRTRSPVIPSPCTILESSL